MEQRMYIAFFGRLGEILRIVSPILVFLLLVIATLGVAVAFIEGWTIGEGIYFAFVTGLTIGYGDFTAKHTLGRIVAVMIGFTGIVFTGVIVAIAVQSLRFVLVDMYGNVENLEVHDASYGILNQARETRKAKRKKRTKTNDDFPQAELNSPERTGES